MMDFLFDLPAAVAVLPVPHTELGSYQQPTVLGSEIKPPQPPKIMGDIPIKPPPPAK